MDGKRGYLAMKTDYAAANELLASDLKEIGNSVKKLANHAIKLGGIGFGTSFLKWVASFAAISSKRWSWDGSFPVSRMVHLYPLNLLVLEGNHSWCTRKERSMQQRIKIQEGVGPMVITDRERRGFYLLILDRTNWKTNILTSLLIPYIFFSLPTLLFSLFRGEVGKWIALIAVVLRLFFPRHFPDWLELPAALILLLVVAPSFFADTIRGHIYGVVICLIIGCYLLQEHIRASGGFRNSFTKRNGISNSIGILLLFVYPVWAVVMFLL